MYGLVLLLSLSYQLSLGYLQEFYTFDGQLSSSFPCDPDAAVSACCLAEYKCETRLYCLGPDQYDMSEPAQIVAFRILAAPYLGCVSPPALEALLRFRSA